jgi:hypothetical protein
MVVTPIPSFKLAVVPYIPAMRLRIGGGGASAR